ncbi:MAG: biopolymer transporter ExbD, partial [Desulfovibrio sp.]|nr:biopolymer transporter ExbD [Desulfovibrio sp.]
PTESDHMVLTVRRDGALFLDEYRVDNLDQLEGYLKSLVKEENKTLFLQADKEVPYGIVVDVMGRIKFVGIEKLGVIAENMDPAEAQAAAKAAGGPAPAGQPAGGQASK